MWFDKKEEVRPDLQPAAKVSQTMAGLHHSPCVEHIVDPWGGGRSTAVLWGRRRADGLHGPDGLPPAGGAQRRRPSPSGGDHAAKLPPRQWDLTET